MTLIRMPGHVTLSELAELELRDAEALLLPADQPERATADDVNDNVDLEMRRVAEDAFPQESVERGLLSPDALEPHLRDLRNRHENHLPSIELLYHVGLVQLLARNDDGKLVRRIAAAIPNNQAPLFAVPLDVEVDVPVLTLLAGRDSSDRVRFLADLVRRASNAVRFLGCDQRGLRSAVRLLREALTLHTDQQAADTDQGRDDHASSQPQNIAHSRSVSNSEASS